MMEVSRYQYLGSSYNFPTLGVDLLVFWRQSIALHWLDILCESFEAGMPWIASELARYQSLIKYVVLLHFFRVSSLANVEHHWTMELLLLGMALTMVLITGLWKTHGVQAGERQAISGWSAIWMAPQPANAVLQWRPPTLSRKAKIPQTLAHLHRLP